MRTVTGSGARLRRLAAKSKWTEAEAREALAAQTESGQSVSAFSRRAGIGGARIGWWRKRLGAGSLAPALLRVHVREEAPGGVVSNGAVEIELAGGRIVRVRRGFDPEELGRVVTALERTC